MKKLQAETLAQVFFELLKSTYFKKHLRATAKKNIFISIGQKHVQVNNLRHKAKVHGRFLLAVDEYLSDVSFIMDLEHVRSALWQVRIFILLISVNSSPF